MHTCGRYRYLFITPVVSRYLFITPVVLCHMHTCGRYRYLFITVATGLWGGLLIGLQTEYFTSNRYQPVQVRLGTLGTLGLRAHTQARSLLL